ncbi:putative toxin-antitoxin system toxin component, PIN family, partial [bacterium]|nr:putative toxin-antitoxin system toxin component, PIN family [bacterium]
MKIVIDTNLFVAGYFNKDSASAKILRMARRNEIQILWTESIKKEVERIIQNIKARKKFQKEVQEIFKEENKVEP